jgi:hypothetical protein
MTVGSRWAYRVTDMADGSTKRQVITVTRKTKLIADGIRARFVRDVVRDHGKPVEITQDWYAQDKAGNVWYFGEHTTAYKHGRLTDNGTWQAGANGAPRCPPSRASGSPPLFWSADVLISFSARSTASVPWSRSMSFRVNPHSSPARRPQ